MPTIGGGNLLLAEDIAHDDEPVKVEKVLVSCIHLVGEGRRRAAVPATAKLAQQWETAVTPPYKFTVLELIIDML